MGWPKGRPRKPRIEGEEPKPKKPRQKRSALRTSDHAPGVKAAESVRQPRQPKPKKADTHSNVRGIFDYRLPHACDLEDTVAEIQEALKKARAKRREFYRDVNAEGGPDLVVRLQVGVQVRDEDKYAELIHRHALETDGAEWSRNASRDRAPQLEDPLEGRVQGSTAGVWSQGEPDAESGDVDGEAGEGEEGETVREVRPANSFTFLD